MKYVVAFLFAASLSGPAQAQYYGQYGNQRNSNQLIGVAKRMFRHSNQTHSIEPAKRMFRHNPRPPERVCVLTVRC